LLASTCLSAVAAAAPAAAQTALSPTATPQGGSVAAGNATITQSTGQTTINQTSQKTVLDWNSFNVGSQATVTFNQPSATAIALNHVTSASPSIIAGHIDANGQLILVNQSGVVFTKGSEVNAESLVVATSNIADKDFLAGRLNFTGAPAPGASIVNDGHITVKDTGLVGLIAPQVANNGTITASLGQVVLAGASAFTLDLYGDQLISLNVTKAVQQVDLGGQTVAALVTNRGLIIADGGKITLTAQDADALVTQLIDAGGTLQANTTASGKAGAVIIGGVGGDISIAGNVLAQGNAAGSQGGSVQALSTGTVTVAATANIDASGQAGGGVIAIGTDTARAIAGTSDTTAPKAEAVTVAPGAVLRADATGTGNGGKVTLLSQQSTVFQGAISVQGGPSGGNGGLAEISSDNIISLGGTVNDAALLGHTGQVLLDPAILVVGGASPSTATIIPPGTTSTRTTILGASSISSITSSDLNSLSGTIILTASSEIDVLAGSSIVLNSSGTELTLSAGIITIGNGSSISVAGSLELDATGSLEVDGGLMADGILLNGGTLSTVLDSNITASSGLTLSGGGVTQTGGVLILSTGVSELSTVGTLSGDLTLDQNNDISSLGGINLTGSLKLHDGGDLSLQGIIKAGSVTITTAGSLTAQAAIEATGGVTLNADDGLALSNQTISATGAVELDTGGTLLVDGITAPSILLNGGTTTPTVTTLAGAIDVGTGGLTFGSDAAVTQTAGLISIASGGALDAVGGTIGGDLLLTQSDNQIGTLGALSLGSHQLDLTDGEALTVPSSLAAGSITLSAAGLTLQGDAASSGALSFTSTAGLNLANTGSLTADSAVLSGTSLDLQSGVSITNLLALDASTGGVTTGSALITASSASLTATAGSIDLGGPFNAGSIWVNSPNFTAASLGGASGGLALTLANAHPTLGNATIGSDLTLTAAHSLIIAGALDASGQSVTLAGAGISESGGAIKADTLSTSGSLTGALNLSGTNSIAVLGSVASAGAVTVNDGTNSVAILSLVSGPQIYLTAGTLSVSSTATVTAANTLAVAVDTLTGNGSLLTSGLIEISTDTDHTLTLNSSLVAAGANAGASAIIFGGTIGPAGIDILLNSDAAFGATPVSLVTTGSITDAAGTLSANNLALSATGVTQSTGAAFDVSTLTSAGALNGNVLLTGTTNQIGTLTALSLSSGTLAVANSIALTLTSLIHAPTLSLTAPSLEIDGTLDSTLLALGSTGTITAANGTVTTGSLISVGTIGGDLLLTGTSNSIASLGDVNVTGALVVHDTAGLTAAGSVAAGNDSLNAPSLTITGTLTGSSVSLTATTLISLPGSLSVASTLALSAPTIMQPGTGIITGTLATITGGGANNSVQLAGTLNNIGTLASFTAASLSLFDNASLTVAGPVSASGNITLTDPVDITFTGSLSASALGLITNGLSFGSLGTVNAEVIEITPYGPGNLIELGGTTLAGLDLTEADFAPLTASTLVVGNAGSTIISDGAISIANTQLVLSASQLTQTSAGSLTAQNLSLASGSLALAGSLSVVGTLALNLVSGATQTAGGITAATLVGAGATGTGNVTLLQTLNNIGTLGAFTVAAGDTLGLLDSSSLTVTGPVRADFITLAASSLVVSGSISDSAGSFTASSTAYLSAASGISLSGSIALGHLTLASTLGGVAQTGGTLTVGSLTGDGSTFGGDLILSAANQIGTLQNVLLPGYTLAVQNTPSLTIVGTLAAKDASITAGGLDLTGTASLTDGLTLGSTAGNILLPGTVSASTLVALSLTGTGSIVESGTLATPTLTVSDASGTLVTLTGTNSLASLGSVFAPDAAFTIDNTAALTLAGPVTVGSAAITAPSLTLTGTLAGSNITLAGASGIDLAGYVHASSLLSLQSNGAISEPGGTVWAPSLLITGGDAELNDDYNTVSALGFAASVMSLTDQTSLTAAGTAGSVYLSAPELSLNAVGGTDIQLVAANDLTFAGSITGDGASLATSLALDAGTIIQTGGTISAQTLTSAGAADGNTSLTQPGNQILTLGGFVLLSGDHLALTDTSTLTVGGPVTADYATLTAPSLDLTGVINNTGTGSSDITLSGTSGIEIPGTITTQRLDLYGGPVTEGGGVTVGTLSGTVGAAALAGTNTITTLSAFTVATGQILALNDSRALTIAGPLQADFITIAAPSLNVSGSISFTTASLASTSSAYLRASNDSISLSGSIDLGHLTLAATQGVTQTSGTLTVGTLTGDGSTFGGDLILSAANQIGTLQNVLLPGYTLAVQNTPSLTIAGTLAAKDASITAGGLDLTGTASLTDGLTLGSTAGNIVLPGTVSASTLVALSLTGTGSIVESGTLATPTLSVSDASGTLVALTGTNSLASLGSVFAPDAAFTLNSTAAVTLAGAVTVSSATLAASSIALDGLVSVASVLSLQSSGAISEASGASLTAQTLAGNGTTVALTAGSNYLTDLGPFAASAISLVDQNALTADGVDADSIYLQAPNLTAADLGGSSITLSVAGLTNFAGAITGAGTTATANLLAITSGTIIQTGGTISAATLTTDNSTVGNTTLTLAGNDIGTLGSFSVTSGASLALADASALVVTGPLTANIVSLLAPTLAVTGIITGDTAASDIALSGTNGIALSGTITAQQLNLLASAGSISQTAGSLAVGTLTGDAETTTSLTEAANQITTLGGFDDSGNLSLTTATQLVTAGSVQAANVAFAADGIVLAAPTLITGTLALSSANGVTATGALDAGVLTTGSLAITGPAAFTNTSNSIGTLGNFTTSSGLTLADASPLAINGSVAVAGTFALGVPAGATQTDGQISAAALTSDGITDGAVSLGQAANAIPVLGSFSDGSSLILSDASALSLQGNLSAGSVLRLADAASITQAAGIITVPVLNASGTSIQLNNANAVGTLGNVSAASSLGVQGVGAVTGLVQAQNAVIGSPAALALSGTLNIGGSLSLAAIGALTQSAGSISVTDAVFTGAGIALSGRTNITNALTANAGAGAFTQQGELTANSATLAAASIGFSGTSNITGDLAVNTAGDLLQTTGTLTVGTLTGTVGTLASLNSNSNIETIGSFIMADSSFALNDIGTLVITGPLVASELNITATGALVLQGGNSSDPGGIFIIGTAASGTELHATGTDSVIDVTGAGAHIQQNGTFFINTDPYFTTLSSGPITKADLANPATLFLSTVSPGNQGGGNIILNQGAGGIVAPSVELVLSAGSSGNILGNVNLLGLEVLGANLVDMTGEIDGLQGEAAAGKATSEPVPLSKYQFNACPIGSVNCVLLPVESIPNTNPLTNFDISQRKRRRLDKAIHLPGVATHDF
jgi:filamentous hemagglutinin family protein